MQREIRKAAMRTLSLIFTRFVNISLFLYVPGKLPARIVERKEEEEAIHERRNATVGVQLLSPSREFSREFSLSCPRSTDSKHSIRSFVTFDGTALGIGLLARDLL